ncbi:MAG: hypothetical protein ACJ8IK_26425 [Burkholderiaceae bacterium]|jgi:hypothetical protein
MRFKLTWNRNPSDAQPGMIDKATPARVAPGLLQLAHATFRG